MLIISNHKHFNCKLKMESIPAANNSTVAANLAAWRSRKHLAWLPRVLDASGPHARSTLGWTSQMFILAGSTDAAGVTDQLLWIVKFWCHYLPDENKRAEPQWRHSAALCGRADPLFFWSLQFEDSVFAFWALIWSVFGALAPVLISRFCNC